VSRTIVPVSEPDCAESWQKPGQKVRKIRTKTHRRDIQGLL
jgi:hypothetical protein